MKVEFLIVAVFAVSAISCPRSGSTGTSTEPETTLRRFYDAVASQDCLTAARLRPGYAEAQCRKVRKVQLKDLDLQYMDGRVAVAYLKVIYALDGSEERFAGNVTLRRDAATGSWVIDNDTFRRGKREALDTYLRRVAGVEPARSAPPTTVREPAKVSTRGVTFGSQAILDSCWRPKTLEGRSDDRAVRKLPKPDAAPPGRTTPVRRLPSVPLAWRGSIRSVAVVNPPGSEQRYVALTFDLCEKANEEAGYDAAVVNTLRREGAQATFFAGGKWMRSHEDKTLQLMADPLFEVGNHGWTHGNLRVLQGEEMREQIVWTQAEYELLWDRLANLDCVRRLDPSEIARVPSSLKVFRFPYGACNQDALDALTEYGLSAIQWDVVSGDPAPGQTPAMLTRAVVERVKPGSIVIMHANGRGRSTAAALPTIIRELRERGFSFVTVSELLHLGKPVAVDECYEVRPGDNARYDTLFGRGTGE